MSEKKLLFVCNGNVHRSVIAALCAQRLLVEHGLVGEYEAFSRALRGSAGTQPPPYGNLRDYATEWRLSSPILREIGIEIPETQKSTPILRADIEAATLVFAMDDLVLHQLPNSLIQQFPEHVGKFQLFSAIAGREEDVPDPRGSEDAAMHRSVILTIDDTLRDHFGNLLQLAA